MNFDANHETFFRLLPYSIIKVGVLRKTFAAIG